MHTTLNSPVTTHIYLLQLPFPGQGRKLVNSTATAGAGIDFSSFLHAGSTSGTDAKGAGVAGELPSREDIAARRLAAMSAKGLQS